MSWRRSGCMPTTPRCRCWTPAAAAPSMPLRRRGTGRLWSYVRDDRPFAGKAAPAVLYGYSPDRKGEHPRAHLGPFRGILQADGYQGYAGLYDRGVTEAACWAHARTQVLR